MSLKNLHYRWKVLTCNIIFLKIMWNSYRRPYTRRWVTAKHFLPAFLSSASFPNQHHLNHNDHPTYHEVISTRHRGVGRVFKRGGGFCELRQKFYWARSYLKFTQRGAGGGLSPSRPPFLRP